MLRGDEARRLLAPGGTFLVLDIARGYEPSPVMKSGEPYIEGYLKHIGVGWAKRKVAVAFRPELSFAIVDGVLQVLMPSPIGERLERFPLDREEPETAP